MPLSRRCNVNDLIESLIKEHKTFPNISEFFLMILVGISEFWDAFLLFKFNISFCVSSIETSLKQKFMRLYPFTDRKKTWMIHVFQNRSNCAIFNSIYWRIILTVFRNYWVFNYLSKKKHLESLRFPIQFWQLHHFQSMYSVSCYNLIGKWSFHCFPKEFIIH